MSKILLIEDDIDLNNAYSMILKQDKYTVKAVHNGEEALDVVDKFDPDLILLDLIMPVKSGLDFLKEYLSRKINPPKVLIITNLVNSSEISEAMTLGGYKCVIKSHTTPQGLRKIVKSTLISKG